eukprot:509602_1
MCCADLGCLHILRLLAINLAAFFAFTVAGFQALLPILHDEGIFASLCEDNKGPCNKQDLRLDLMYNLSIGALHIICILWGYLCLHCHPKYCILAGGTCITVGSIAFAFGWDWLCFFGYISMGFGSSGIVFGVIAIPAEYPINIQGALFSIITGFVEASSGIYYLFLVLYKDFNVSMKILFLSLGVTTCVLQLSVYLFVFSSYFTKDKKQMDVEEQLVVNDKTGEIPKHHSSQDGMATAAEEDPGRTVEKKDLENLLKVEKNAAKVTIVWTSWKQVFTSIEFFSILTFCMMYITTKYFYITTLDEQLTWITNDNHHKVYLGQQIFSVMLLCSGFFTILSGPIIDRGGMKFAVSVLATNSMIIASCSIIKIYNLQWFTMALFVFNRFMYFAMAPLLLAAVFGIDRQQFAFGIVGFTGAFFNLTGYVLDYLSMVTFHGNFTFANMFSASCCFVSAVVLINVLWRNANVT